MPNQQQREPVEPRKGREGGRWINERPTSEEFGSWFKANMKLDKALEHENYVGGVVLIPAVDTKAKFVVGFHPNGRPIIEEGEELSYIPYAKVETRINYFWDLLDLHQDEWVGVVEHVKLDRMPIDIGDAVQDVTEADGKNTVTTRPGRADALVAMVHQMPEGFSLMSIPVGNGYSHFLCCTIRVSIFRKGEDGEPTGRALRTGRGTKQIPLLKGGFGNRQPYADDSSMMKAETGAQGRALGFAGIFVIPGSGVATAEDMQEQMVGGVVPSTPEQAPEPAENAGPTLPEVQPVRTGAEQAQDDETSLRAKAMDLWRVLQAEHPEKAKEFPGWANSRGLRSLGEARGATLRGVVVKLEKMTDEADRASQQQPLIGETDAPAEPSGQAGSDEPGSGAGDGVPVQPDS